MTQLRRFVNLVALLVLGVCLHTGSAADHKRRIGPFPGFLGNQNCVKQEGLTTSCDQSSFLLACRNLTQLKTCYYKGVTQSRKYFDQFFNSSKFIPAYTTMCSKLNAYVKLYGLFNLRRLESNPLRKHKYQQAYAKLTEYANENNTTETVIATACKKIMEWTQDAEFLAGDDLSLLRTTMHDTLRNMLTDTCLAHLGPTTLFPSLYGITLSKIGTECMNSEVPQWYYLFDRKIKCDKPKDTATDTHWGHLSCGRAEQTLECINTYFNNNNIEPDTATYVAKYLFDLKQQKKAFKIYCAQSRDVRQRLQCVSDKRVKWFQELCYEPWIARINYILREQQHVSDKSELCQITKNKIKCEENILSRDESEAASLYAELQRDSLPLFCSDAEPRGSTTEIYSTEPWINSTDITLYVLCILLILIGTTCFCLLAYDIHSKRSRSKLDSPLP